jgi:hypothetical protein
MNLTSINAAIDAAYSAALAHPQKVAPATVGDDANQTVQTVVYEAPIGSGFRVVGKINVGGATILRVRNSGPDTGSERAWPADIEAEVARQIGIAKQAKGQEIYRTGRAATLAIWNTALEAQTIGNRVKLAADFQSIMDASDEAAKSGDIAKAKAIVSTVTVPDSMSALQSALVSALDAVLARATALGAATTIEEIKAI